MMFTPLYSYCIDVVVLIQARNQSYKLASKLILKLVGMCVCEIEREESEEKGLILVAF